MIRRCLLYGIRLSVALLIVGGLWGGGLVFFTHLIPVSPPPHTAVDLTDGLVIFTGGETRLRVALSLFDQQKARYLLISGVNPDSRLRERLAPLAARSRITLGYDALDTLGNAMETAQWAKQHQIKTLRLITSNYHMPRSLFELRHLLPHIQIYPYPVVGKSFLKPKWWLDPRPLYLVIQEYNKFLFALLRRPFEDLQLALRQ